MTNEQQSEETTKNEAPSQPMVIKLPDIPVVTDLRHRRGRLRISKLFLDEITPDMAVIFGVFYPIEAIHNSFQKHVTYWGYSPYFRPLGEGEAIPEYQVWLRKNEANEITFDRVEEMLYFNVEQEFMKIMARYDNDTYEDGRPYYETNYLNELALLEERITKSKLVSPFVVAPKY